MSSDGHKSGFVSLIGRPNSGKSTLLNTLLGEDLSIVTPLPQTTRRNMRGILTGSGFQIVFVDTPGIHRQGYRINEAMYRQSIDTLKDNAVDIVCYLIDLSRKFGEEEDAIAAALEKVKSGIVVIFNKSDLCTNTEERVTEFCTRYPHLAGFPRTVLSALSQEAGKGFLDTLLPLIDYGPRFYPEGELSDLNLRFFASEYIRSAVIDMTENEVPHATCVEIEDYKENNGVHCISGVIHVETQGQKGIVIGNKGRRLRAIRRKATKKMEILTQEECKLECHVKVSPGWRNNRAFLAEMGYE